MNTKITPALMESLFTPLPTGEMKEIIKRFVKVATLLPETEELYRDLKVVAYDINLRFKLDQTHITTYDIHYIRILNLWNGELVDSIKTFEDYLLRPFFGMEKRAAFPEPARTEYLKAVNYLNHIADIQKERLISSSKMSRSVNRNAGCRKIVKQYIHLVWTKEFEALTGKIWGGIWTLANTIYSNYRGYGNYYVNNCKAIFEVARFVYLDPINVELEAIFILAIDKLAHAGLLPEELMSEWRFCHANLKAFLYQRKMNK